VLPHRSPNDTGTPDDGCTCGAQATDPFAAIALPGPIPDEREAQHLCDLANASSAVSSDATGAVCAGPYCSELGTSNGVGAAVPIHEVHVAGVRLSATATRCHEGLTPTGASVTWHAWDGVATDGEAIALSTSDLASEDMNLGGGFSLSHPWGLPTLEHDLQAGSPLSYQVDKFAAELFPGDISTLEHALQADDAFTVWVDVDFLSPPVGQSQATLCSP